MERGDGFAVPVEVGEEEEGGFIVDVVVVGGGVGVWKGRSGRAVNNVFLLCFAVEDVVDPGEGSFGALGGHVRADVGGVEGGGFGDDAEALGGVFGDVFFGAGVDEVDFVVGGWWRGGAGGFWAGGAVGEEPEVDVVGA